MPVHDWTQVNAGIFHDFHHDWITMLKRALNAGRLPPGYYALAEQIAGDLGPDVLTLDLEARRRSRVGIRRGSGHKVVAMIEVVSPGDKSRRQSLRSFVANALEVLEAGIHLLLVDLFPPSPRNPQGIHGAIWSEIEEDGFQLPPDKRLTLAAYSAGLVKCAFIEPVAVGDLLPDMPLFLEPQSYIPVPLEATYQSAWEGVPQYWRDQLERSGPTT